MNQQAIRQSIDPRTIRTDLNTRVREIICEDTIREYAEAMESGTVFPPLTVFFDLETERYILADGFLRLFAHLRVKPNDPIIVEQYLGNVEEAQWHGIGANKMHGLKRTNEDKRKAVELALLHPNGAGKSDNSIADHVGVTQPFVLKVRKQMTAEGRLITVISRVGKDGRIYDVSNIGGKPAGPCSCVDCGHYETPYCLIEGETREPTQTACEEFVPIPPPVAERVRESLIGPIDTRIYEPKEVRHRVSRRKPGEYVDVPLSKSNTDIAAAEIRHYFNDNYLAALVQSANKLLKNKHET